MSPPRRSATTSMGPESGDRVANLFDQVEVDRLDTDPATPVDAAHIEQVVDQATHAADLRADDAKVRHLLALAVEFAAEPRLEELGIALDAGQRGPQLVADDREEIVLHARRGLLARHPLLEVGPQLRVLQCWPGTLRHGLRHPRDALVERT